MNKHRSATSSYNRFASLKARETLRVQVPNLSRRISIMPSSSCITHVKHQLHCLRYCFLIAFCLIFYAALGKLVVLSAFWIYVTIDGLLARLAGWGISTIPKSFDWTIESISVRPSWSSAYPTEIIVTHWTWHNPQPGTPSAAFSSTTPTVRTRECTQDGS